MILIICQCSKIFNMCLKLTRLNKEKKKTNYYRDFFLLTVNTKIQIKLQKKPRTNWIFWTYKNRNKGSSFLKWKKKLWKEYFVVNVLEISYNVLYKNFPKSQIIRDTKLQMEQRHYSSPSLTHTCFRKSIR